MFENMLKYSYVSQKANEIASRRKMAFQIACRKLQRSKDLGPEGTVQTEF
jgi:hypothetical protein